MVDSMAAGCPALKHHSSTGMLDIENESFLLKFGVFRPSSSFLVLVLFS